MYYMLQSIPFTGCINDALISSTNAIVAAVEVHAGGANLYGALSDVST